MLSDPSHYLTHCIKYPGTNLRSCKHQQAEASASLNPQHTHEDCSSCGLMSQVDPARELRTDIFLEGIETLQLMWEANMRVYTN